jgi:hypothetical protein
MQWRYNLVTFNKIEGYWGQETFSTIVYQDKALIDKYELDNEIPLTFLIDKDGRLVYMHCGYWKILTD